MRSHRKRQNFQALNKIKNLKRKNCWIIFAQENYFLTLNLMQKIHPWPWQSCDLNTKIKVNLNCLGKFFSQVEILKIQREKLLKIYLNFSFDGIKFFLKIFKKIIYQISTHPTNYYSPNANQQV